ncbi:MAG TPA: class I SAM-dependent methyltransferase [Gammaproteobacteria bacterium]|jgi:2-polyprenyl-3-methyl-5-hydroxy-6-metoxy-1,4-benzoquinol methylase
MNTADGIGGPETFFVKDGYECNHAAASEETAELAAFWTPERIRNVFAYQYHVYELAARIARDRGFRTGLDIGCGPATKTRSLLAPVVKELVLVDQPACAALVAKALPGARFVPLDLETCALTLPGDFELIICADVLEHLANPRPCLDFAREHLAAGGVAVFSTPERDTLHGTDCTRCLHDAHVREWNLAEFRSLLEWAGFVVTAQLTLPGARLPWFEERLRLLTPSGLRPRKWRSCQVVLCAARSGG